MRLPLLRLLGHGVWLFAVAGLASSAVYGILTLAPGTPKDLPPFAEWAGGLLQGDLGASTEYRPGESVATLIAAASFESAIIVVAALSLALVVAGVLAWWWSGQSRPRTAAATRGLTYVLSASPAFLLAYWALIIVNGTVAQGIERDWWGPPQWFPVPHQLGWISYLLASVVLAVGSGVLMETARGLSAELDRLLKADFVLFARAAGRPLWRHVGPSLVGPLVTLAVNRLSAIFGGAVIVELIFNVPGLGRLIWDAALARDANVLLGATVVWAMLYATTRLSVEAVVVMADPRARRQADLS